MADFVICVLSRLRHYNRPQRSGSVGGSRDCSSQCQRLSQRLAPVSVSAWPHYGKSPSMRPYRLVHKVNFTLHLPLQSLPCTAYNLHRLPIGSVLLRAILAVTCVAGTAVNRGQEVVMSYRLLVDVSP